MLKFKVNGKKFLNDLTKTKEQIKKNVASDSFEILEIVNKHTEPLVPLETGELRASILKNPKGMLVEGDYMSQEITYSAKNKRTGFDYALIQHENYEYRHTVGQWLYLTDGIIASEGEVYRLIEKDIDSAMAQTLKGGR